MPAQILFAVRFSELAVDRLRIANFLRGEAFFLRLVPILFGACAYLATQHTVTSSAVSAIWPANGILLAALLLAQNDRPIWLRTLATCVVANILANIAVGHPPLAIVGFALINAGECAAAFALLRYIGAADPSEISIGTLIQFAFAVLVVCAGAAFLGASIAAISLDATFRSALVTWYVADVLGLLVITPAFAMAFRAKETTPVRSSRTGTVGLGFLMVLTCGVVFGQSSYPLLFLVTPVCVAIAFRLGIRYSSFATLFLTIVSIWATYAGTGPAALIAADDEVANVWVVQLFCLVNHFATVFVAATVSQRDLMRRNNERLAQKEREGRRRLNAALNAMNQGLCLFDRHGYVTEYNARFLELYRLEPSQTLVGFSFDALTALSCRAGLLATSVSCSLPLMTEGDMDQELSDDRIIRISQRSLAGDGVVCTYTDVTAERRAEQTLRHASLHDPLTSLPNRRHFACALTQRCAGAKTAGEVFSVMFADVDHFKTINDRLGHRAGDVLLQVVSKRLLACIRTNDIVARLGGDEFAVILEGADEATARSVAERMLESVREPVFIEGQVALVTLSLGIAAYAAGFTADELMNKADVALYAVKDHGRDGLKVAETPNNFIEHNVAEDDRSAITLPMRDEAFTDRAGSQLQDRLAS